MSSLLQLWSALQRHVVLISLSHVATGKSEVNWFALEFITKSFPSWLFCRSQEWRLESSRVLAESPLLRREWSRVMNKMEPKVTEKLKHSKRSWAFCNWRVEEEEEEPMKKHFTCNKQKGSGEEMLRSNWESNTQTSFIACRCNNMDWSRPGAVWWGVRLGFFLPLHWKTEPQLAVRGLFQSCITCLLAVWKDADSRSDMNKRASQSRFIRFSYFVASLLIFTSSAWNENSI